MKKEKQVNNYIESIPEGMNMMSDIQKIVNERCEEGNIDNYINAVKGFVIFNIENDIKSGGIILYDDGFSNRRIEHFPNESSRIKYFNDRIGRIKRMTESFLKNNKDCDFSNRILNIIN